MMAILQEGKNLSLYAIVTVVNVRQAQVLGQIVEIVDTENEMIDERAGMTTETGTVWSAAEPTIKRLTASTETRNAPSAVRSGTWPRSAEVAGTTMDEDEIDMEDVAVNDKSETSIQRDRAQ